MKLIPFHLTIKGFIALIFILGFFDSAAQELYKNPLFPVNERVIDLISRMKPEEKISQLGNNVPAIPRLGISSYNYWSEALHGVAFSGLATSFPQVIALSSTWNPELIFQIATAISDEARVKNNTYKKGLTYWSPTINMARDPRWGRTEESYGEDPYLTSIMAVNFVRGMQGNDPKYLKTVSTVKHFACNNIEKNRHGISSDVDERSLREYYLPAFEWCVTKGGVISVMSAYNALNDVPCPANRTLLTNILRDEWGFTGYVVSDCGAVSNVWNNHHYVQNASDATAISIKNGTDLNCGTTYPDNAESAIAIGLMSEQDIDTALKRIFTARFLLGEFDPSSLVPYTSIPASQLDCKANRNLALRAAREAIVLLKNQDSILPLKKDANQTFAIIGPNADVVQLGGYSGSPSVSVTPLMGIASKLGIDISNGTIEAESYTFQKGIQTESCEEGGSNIGYIESGDYAVYDSVNFGSGKSKFDIRVASNTNGGNLVLILDSINGTTIGVYPISGTGGWQNWITLSNEIFSISGIHNVYLKFTGYEGYLFNLNWFRFYNEDNTDPLTGGGRISFAKGCPVNGDIDQAEFDTAVSLAQKSDIAIVVCGTDMETAREGLDRTSLNLPGVQEELIKAVYHANPKTVVVLVSGFPLEINWLQDSIPAIISAWYDGQAQGTAIADVLFGDFNPKGKLTSTWYKSISDLPLMSDYDIKNNRTYMYFKGTPLYPFGYGLSYTNFEYGNLHLSSGSLNAGDSLQITAQIKNTGKLAGDEVVQFYVHTISKTNLRPLKELKGFETVHLQPGETKTVSFYLRHDALSYYNVNYRTFDVENGKVEILIGASSADIRLTDKINVSGGTVATTYRQDPFNIIEAEHFENKFQSIDIIACPTGGQCVGSLENDSYIMFRNLDFSSVAKQFSAYYSSINSDSQIQVMLDSLNGRVAGTLNAAFTGSSGAYKIKSCVLDDVSGVRDIYLVFKTHTKDDIKLNWFSFQKTVGEIVDIETIENKLSLKIFPNPAHASINLKYELPEESDIKIEFYTVSGLLERTIYMGKRGKGLHQDQIEISGYNLSSGLHIIRFSTRDFSKSMMIEIIK
ncbi:MAG: glycoside hydrolase family 3 C-terminal domain-containing protein [Bacteroidales bacterium]|nr:glycoside hydrolase family 3 C-terminal domain-containing protein [Bacteroidales bacterium]